MYLFIFGCPGSLLLLWGLSLVATRGCSSSQCLGRPCCRGQAPGTQSSVVGAPGLESASSGVVTPGLSCSAPCGIFPDQRLNPVRCACRWIPVHCTTGQSQCLFLPFQSCLLFLPWNPFCLMLTLMFSLCWHFPGLPFPSQYIQFFSITLFLLSHKTSCSLTLSSI